MKSTARFFKRGLGLHPVDPAARKMLAEMPEGAAVFMQVWKPRNIAQHNKYFAVLNNVVEATGKWPSTEALRFDIFRHLKRGTVEVSQVDGFVSFRADSMSFASMPKDEFERLYEDTMRLLTEWLECDPEVLTLEAA